MSEQDEKQGTDVNVEKAENVTVEKEGDSGNGENKDSENDDSSKTNISDSVSDQSSDQ